MKRHRVKCNSTRHRRREGLGCSWVLNRILDRKQFNQAFGCPCGPLQFPPDFREGRNTTRDHNRVNQKLHQCPCGHLIGPHIIGTNPQNTHNTRKDQKDDYGRHPCACGNPTTRHDKAFFRHIIKGFARQRLMRKGLNRLHSPKVLRGIARAVCNPILVFLTQLTQATPQGQDGNNDGGHDQQNQPCQLCRGQQHHPQSTDKDQQVAQRNRNR